MYQLKGLWSLSQGSDGAPDAAKALDTDRFNWVDISEELQT